MTAKYRITMKTSSGMEIMCKRYEDSTAWENEWGNIFKNTAAYAGNGLLIAAKEYLTEGGNWESDDKIPMFTGERQ